MIIKDLLKIIENHKSRNKLTDKYIYEKLDMSRSTYTDTIKKNYVPKTVTFIKLCKVLNLSYSELLDEKPKKMQKNIQNGNGNFQHNVQVSTAPNDVQNYVKYLEEKVNLLEDKIELLNKLLATLK